jgi:PadR family transcriptional regulator PadR
MEVPIQLDFAMLDACVLAVLGRGDAYGYILTQNIKGTIDVSESTLYPVLRRLQKEGLLSTYDDSFNGRNRRYYRITDRGQEKLVGYVRKWQEYQASLNEILLGGNSEQG